MAYASKDLIEEHEAILHGLSILEKMTALLDTPTDALSKDLQDMVDFLVLFADTCHHGKEEGLLFPAMEQAGIPKEGGPIGQMLHEHEQGRAFIRGMKQALGGESVDAGAFRTNASGYIELLRAHIEKENQILFPMGDRFLPPEKQQELLEAFDKHEEEVIGAGVHERLHAMLDNFASRY